jgi:hypothetical protein
VVVLEFGVRVTEGGDTTGVTDGGGDGGGDVTGFDPQAAAVTSMTAGTTSASLKQDRVGPGVEIITSTFLAILD